MAVSTGNNVILPRAVLRSDIVVEVHLLSDAAVELTCPYGNADDGWQWALEFASVEEAGEMLTAFLFYADEVLAEREQGAGND